MPSLPVKAAKSCRAEIETAKEKTLLFKQAPQAAGGLQPLRWHLVPTPQAKDKGGHCEAVPDAEGCPRLGGLSGSADLTWSCQPSLWTQAT